MKISNTKGEIFVILARAIDFHLEAAKATLNTMSMPWFELIVYTSEKGNPLKKFMSDGNMIPGPLDSLFEILESQSRRAFANQIFTNDLFRPPTHRRNLYYQIKHE